MDRLTADQQNLKKCISGDKKAQEEFVRHFSDPIYKWIQFTLKARQMPFDRQDLEDLHNTVFVQLFEKRCKKLRQYRGKNGCSVFSWIRLITIRIVIDYIRSTSRDAIARSDAIDILQNIPDLSEGEADRLNLMEKAEQARLVRKAMRVLPARDRLFLKLHCLQGLPIARVAGILKITVNNAYSRKHRAIQRLKKAVVEGTEN
jgi:RNA polymerase sigma factor (sigma-70 family)